MRFGATFSEPYARSLGIYPAVAYWSVTHEIRLELIRLCAFRFRFVGPAGPGSGKDRPRNHTHSRPEGAALAGVSSAGLDVQGSVKISANGSYSQSKPPYATSPMRRLPCGRSKTSHTIVRLVASWGTPAPPRDRARPRPRRSPHHADGQRGQG